MSHLPGRNIEESNSHPSASESLEADSGMSERDKLIKEQMKDHELAKLAQEAVDDDELAINPKCYFKQFGVLMRKWRPRDVPATDAWRTIYQIVVPQSKSYSEAWWYYSLCGKWQMPVLTQFTSRWIGSTMQVIFCG